MLVFSIADEIQAAECGGFLQQPTISQAENKNFTWRFIKPSVLIWNFLG